jgi:HlyD family secretion protein
MNEFFTGLLAAVLALLPHQEVATGFNGYLEADYVYVAPISAGRINAVAVAEGDTVAAGELVFALDTTQQQNLLNAALARVAAAEATLENLETGSRGAELDVIRASLSKAEADLAQARSNLTRSERLAEAGTVPGVRVEQDRTALATAQAQVEQLRAQLAVAELPARSAQQVAAEANLRAAEADAERARQELEDRRVVAPVHGVVDKLFYTMGEVAGSGSPVVSLLPTGPLEAWFFVPEMQRAGLSIGEAVRVTCDGCDVLRANITHIASAPQTTPPIIYSREERNRLVYLVKAELEAANTLRPGQPITVLP